MPIFQTSRLRYQVRFFSWSQTFLKRNVQNPVALRPNDLSRCDQVKREPLSGLGLPGQKSRTRRWVPWRPSRSHGVAKSVISQWYENRNDGCDGGMAGKLTKVIRLKSFASKIAFGSMREQKRRKISKNIGGIQGMRGNICRALWLHAFIG